MGPDTASRSNTVVSYTKIATTTKNSKAKSSKTIELVSNNTKTNEGNESKNATGSADVNECKSKNKEKKVKNSTAASIEGLTNHMSKMGSSSDDSAIENDRNLAKTVDQIPNGITKKRSELNIGTLEVSEPATISGHVEEHASNVNKPPPGFNLKPPPGFSNFNVPSNPLSNDLTFTNSSGQSYSIIPSQQQFYLPPNFKTRNHSLIEKFLTVLKDSDAIQQFKVYSDMFRLGEIPAEKYYDHCRNFMGSEFGTIFPELLVLLPNVQRQQELYKVHQSNGRAKGLEMCATCKQVVLVGDLRNHLSNHVLDNHFPVLSQSSIESNNVWNKK